MASLTYSSPSLGAKKTTFLEDMQIAFPLLNNYEGIEDIEDELNDYLRKVRRGVEKGTPLRKKMTRLIHILADIAILEESPKKRRVYRFNEEICRDLIEKLNVYIAALIREQENNELEQKTCGHSDQELLDDANDLIDEKIDAVERILSCLNA
jgi:hypothetical protein